jgi:hypothetical protein
MMRQMILNASIVEENSLSQKMPDVMKRRLACIAKILLMMDTSAPIVPKSLLVRIISNATWRLNTTT